jgi:hypothetical protein
VARAFFLNQARKLARGSRRLRLQGGMLTVIALSRLCSQQPSVLQTITSPS